MCILQSCKNPTLPGVWSRDDTTWCLYSARHQNLIRASIVEGLQQIDLGAIVSNIHPSGARYVVNLQSMEQVAVSSGQRRPVMIVDTVSSQPPQLQAPPQATLLPRPPGSSRSLSLNLHYRDSQGNMQPYDRAIAQAIVRNLASGSYSLLVPDGRSGYLYFDLEAMEQFFVSHLVRGQPVLSNKPPVKVIAEVPWNAGAMRSLAAQADTRLRRNILVMVIDRLRSDEHLDHVLPLKACPWKILSKSTSICSAPLHEKFIDSVEEIVQTHPGDLMGDMIRMTESGESWNGPVQMAFKPVKRLGGSSVMETAGTKATFWMSMAAPVAAAHAVVYCCTVQIFAYLVILPTRTLKKFDKNLIGDRCFGYVEVDRIEHQLPLAEVLVR